MKISETIKRIREEKGFKQADIAKKLKIEPSNYNRLEKRDAKLTVEQLIAIGEVLGVSLGELLGIEGNTVSINDQQPKLKELQSELIEIRSINKSLIEANSLLMEERETMKSFLELAKNDRDAFLKALDTSIKLNSNKSILLVFGLAIALAETVKNDEDVD